MSLDTPVHPVTLADQQPSKANVPILDIKPTRGWGSLDLHEIWQYRELLWLFTWRNIKGSHRQKALGPLWIILQPLFNMVIFSLIFGYVAKLPSDGIPYPIFTYTALLPWTYFSTSAQGAVNSLVGQMGVISKVYFPRLVVPLAAIIGGLINFVISFVILLGMMVFYGIAPRWAILTLPFYLLLAMATALTVGLWNATLAVRFRDVQDISSYILRVWMYATPVAYSASLIPERWQLLYQLNPMYWVVEGFRWALLGTGQPPQPLMLVPTGFVLLLLIIGAFVFRRTERTIVDLL
jgi:lipopolysaccharide transport system permease protein